MAGIQIVDVTLRDGSNAIDFQFDEASTQGILQGLDEAGVPFIDMGHGLGLGASINSGKKAKLSDAEYQDIARETVKQSKWGVFFQPKFGSLDDIAQAAMRGASFIRVGTDVNNIKAGEPYIAFAKDKGLAVHSCLMKAYAVDVETYVLSAKEVAGYGADLVVFMDSAGAMLPDRVDEYMSEALARVDVDHGFHAHNNLDLALCNTLAALKAGVTHIDASLKGMGRSSGNASTEILALVLKKMGAHTGLDWKKLQDTAENYVYPLKHKWELAGNMESIFGFAGFHSGFEGLVDKSMAALSGDLQIDKRDVIIALSDREKINVTDRIVDEVIREMITSP